MDEFRAKTKLSHQDLLDGGVDGFNTFIDIEFSKTLADGVTPVRLAIKRTIRASDGVLMKEEAFGIWMTTEKARLLTAWMSEVLEKTKNH